MGLIMEIVRAIRNARAEYNVQPGQRIPATIVAGETLPLLRDRRRAVRAGAARSGPADDPGGTCERRRRSLTLVAGSASIYLPLAGLVDLGAERQRLEKELAEVEAQAQRSRDLLAGPFAGRAPAQVVQRERDKLAEMEERQGRLQARLRDLQ